MTTGGNLPNGWEVIDFGAYAKVDLTSGGSIYAEPGDDLPIEYAGRDLTIAQVEELAARLSEAVAICKAVQS